MGRWQSEENRQRRIETDNDVAEQNRRSRVAAQRRFHLDSFYRAYIDDEGDDLGTAWDALREGRAR